jgi:hypothetical protein
VLDPNKVFRKCISQTTRTPKVETLVAPPSTPGQPSLGKSLQLNQVARDRVKSWETASISPSGIISLRVCLGCQNKILPLGRLKQQKFIL